MNDTEQPITVEQALWLAESLVRAAREAAAAGRTTLPADTFAAPARAAFEALGTPSASAPG